jgi:hypothetical protein
VDFRRRLAGFGTRAEFHTALGAYREWRAQFCDERGELRPKYQPPKLVASFMRTEAGRTGDSIPVPRGPIERW